MNAIDAMIASQLIPGGVTDGPVLEAFRLTPRERFVPEDKKPFAYADTAIETSDGTLPDALSAGRLVSFLAASSDTNVLVTGDTTGYLTALLSRLCRFVTVLESDTGRLARMSQRLSMLRRGNVRLIVSLDELPPGERFARIWLAGHEKAQDYQPLLSDTGKLLAKEAAEGATETVVYERNGPATTRTVMAVSAVRPGDPVPPARQFEF